jgi:hypothetical protein
MGFDQAVRIVIGAFVGWLIGMLILAVVRRR